ncbi:MAG: hypothetical protein BGO98_04910 [Myxococcales bacterium 68-20]|nr:MAG: hypothetical protein BGO98_04910 [Myxococcales bacterium 68-20]
MKLVALSVASIALVACRSSEPAPPPTRTVDVVKTDTASTIAHEAPSVDAEASTSASTRPTAEPPPSGTYAVSISDRSNTCPAIDAGAWESQPLWVLVQPAKDGAWKANLPVNTGVGSPGLDRHDLLLDVGRVERSALRPDRTCAYEIAREMQVLEVSPSKIVVRVRSEYSDAVRCTLPRRPVSCNRDAVVTYTLAKPFCASRCIAQMTLARDGGVDATCHCPDAGAP